MSDKTRRGPASRPHEVDVPQWARRLRAAREARGLSVLALAAETGVKQRTAYDHDAGRYPPDALEAVRYAAALGLTVEQLFSEQPL